MRSPIRTVLAASLVLVGLTSCSDSKPGVKPPTLPSGALRHLVLQPTDLPIALAPLYQQTGPAGLDRIAEFSANAEAAGAALKEHGFVEAYVAEYGDPATHRIVVNVVTRFATLIGAAADFQSDAANAAKTGTPLAMPDLGDEASATSEKLTTSSQEGTLLTVRWRVGTVTWLLALGNAKPVTTAEARQLAELLIARAAASPPPD